MGDAVIGQERIIELRTQGYKPQSVFVNFGLLPSKGSWDGHLAESDFPELYITPAEVEKIHDLRFLIGLNVIVSAFVSGGPLFRFMEACAAAKAKQVLCVVDGDIVRYVGGKVEVL